MEEINYIQTKYLQDVDRVVASKCGQYKPKPLSLKRKLYLNIRDGIQNYNMNHNSELCIIIRLCFIILYNKFLSFLNKKHSLPLLKMEKN